MKNEIKIQDKHNNLKTHVFRFHKDGHITYNQGINGALFYSSFKRINGQFGYSEELHQAKEIRKQKELIKAVNTANNRAKVWEKKFDLLQKAITTSKQDQGIDSCEYNILKQLEALAEAIR